MFFAKMDRAQRNLSRDECVQAVTLAQEGMSCRAIGLRLGVSHTTISRCVLRFNETNNYTRRPGQGRTRITSRVQDRFITLRALRERFITSRRLQMQLSEVHNIQVSLNTVRRRLTEQNLHVRIPATGPTLNAGHRRARLQFGRDHVNWNIEDWSRVLFTDESRFCLYNSDRRVRVVRRPNERYAQCNIRAIMPFNGGSVMVWGGITYDARTNLVPILDGSLTSRRYIGEILSEHVVPFAHNRNNFILMHDNARPHTARIVNDYLDNSNIEILNWPARSPDLNPIEHLWDNIGRQLRNRQPPPASLYDVQQIITEIWNELNQDVIRNLISSMHRRCEAVIASRGGNTRY